MKDNTPQHRTIPWKLLVLLGVCATATVACRPTNTNAVNAEAAPGTAEGNLREQLNPANQPPPARATAFVAPPPWNPVTIFPVPVRSWLPPAETPEGSRILPGEQRVAALPPRSLRESTLLAPLVPPPERVILPAAALARAASPDSTRIAVWIATTREPGTRGQPPNWDRPQLTTDPTAAESRAAAFVPPSGLRVTPPPFLRVTIPDPFEQIAIAELRNPPPENEPPVTPFARPSITLPVSPEPTAGK